MIVPQDVRPSGFFSGFRFIFDIEDGQKQEITKDALLPSLCAKYELNIRKVCWPIVAHGSEFRGVRSGITGPLHPSPRPSPRTYRITPATPPVRPAIPKLPISGLF